MSTWQFNKTSAPAPPPAAAAEYHAVVTLAVDRSAVSFEVAAPALAHALESAPEWTLRPWPSDHRVSDAASRELFLLLKLEALFDFAATPAEPDANVVQSAIDTRFPNLAAARRNDGVRRFKRFEIAAFVRVDGRADWHYDIPAEGELPPDIVRSDELDDFIRNAVRVDLKQRIAAHG